MYLLLANKDIEPISVWRGGVRCVLRRTMVSYYVKHRKRTHEVTALNGSNIDRGVCVPS